MFYSLNRALIFGCFLSFFAILYIGYIISHHGKPFKFPFIKGIMSTDLRDGDYMKHLVGYIEKNLSKGYNVDQLKIVLIGQGYSRAAVERAMKLVAARLPKPMPVAIQEKPKVEFSPEPEKKPGFFARLFGLGKKKTDKIEIDPATGDYRY